MFQNPYMELFLTFIHQVWSFGAGLDRGFARRGHSFLLTIHVELSKSQHYAPSPFTPAICPSHTLQLCRQGRVTNRGERGKRKAKKWERRNEQLCIFDWTMLRELVTCSALPFIYSFIYYHTTAESLYILIDYKTQTYIHADHGHDL